MTHSQEDERILRDVLIRELETIQEYQAMLQRASEGDVRRFLAHAIKEEKEHVAEAMQLLRGLDPMQDRALAEDHSAHFRKGGPGDHALRDLGLGEANGARDDAAPMPSAQPARTQHLPAVPPQQDGRASEALMHRWKVAPNARMDLPTVGNLRTR